MPQSSKSSNKKSKSRAKSTKSDTASSSAGSTATSNTQLSTTQLSSQISSSAPCVGYVSTAPTTPTTSSGLTSNSLLDAQLTPTSSSTNVSSTAESSGGTTKGHHKNYAGFEPRSVKIIWEQHDQTDVELSQEVCARVAEDASYKLWELMNSIKIYARHSGGSITYDLVNEVLRDADIPPALGAMDSPWDRVDYDGSFFFYTDKILELRDEYQKELQITIPEGPDFTRNWILDDKHIEIVRKYIPSLVYVLLHGERSSFDEALKEASMSPIIAYSYRVLMAKLIQLLAYKQTDIISERCWRLLRACSNNPYARETDYREEFFHLAEILVCQLLGPYECIRTQKTEVQAKTEPVINFADGQEQELNTEAINHGQVYKLQPDEDDLGNETTDKIFSPYFASPVDIVYVPDLCSTLGHLAAQNGYFLGECTFLITRRLERFFKGRIISKEREYTFVSRAIRGLIALGEYAFREFIPFIYQFHIENAPESITNDFAVAALYLNGPDDIFLYEWLEHFCGADKLQPFMAYYAHYHEKLLKARFIGRRATFKIIPKTGVRRLEWSTLAAAMCHGDDPAKAINPKPSINEVFPDLVIPDLQLNQPGNIRFKFAGCRPVILKSKTKCKIATDATDKSPSKGRKPDGGGGAGGVGFDIRQHDILIARRKLLKPLTNEKRALPLSSYYFLTI